MGPPSGLTSGLYWINLRARFHQSWPKNDSVKSKKLPSMGIRAIWQNINSNFSI